MWRKALAGSAVIGMGIAVLRRSRPPVILHGKVALITGASSGIGRAIALALAREGVHVALLARRADRLEALVAKITQHYPAVRAIAVPADLTVDSDMQAAVQHTLESFGRIDMLINDAGLAIAGPLVDYDPATIRRVIDLNLTATIRLTQTILPIMARQRSGHILTLGSTAGILLSPGFSVYGTTKAALIAFSDMLRRELAQTGIAVSIIIPTWTHTAMAAHMDESEMKRVGLINIIAGNFYEPDAIARQVVDMIRTRTSRRMIGSPLYALIYGIPVRLFPHLTDLFFRFYFLRYDRAAFLRALKRFG